MERALKYAFKHLPVTNRFGQGAYTYTLIEVSHTNSVVKRYEVFADNVDLACRFISMNMPLAGYQVFPDRTGYELFSQGSNPALSRWFLYLL